MTPSIWAATIVDVQERGEWVFYSSQLVIVGERPHYTDQEYLKVCQLHDPRATLRIRPVVRERGCPAHDKEIHRLREEGWTCKQIGERLGLTTMSVGTWCWRRGYKRHG